jgi:hypothetical protein
MKETFIFKGKGKSLISVKLLKITQRKGWDDKVKIKCINYEGETFIDCVITPEEGKILALGLLKAEFDSKFKEGDEKDV